jgi:hypothetical protein
MIIPANATITIWTASSIREGLLDSSSQVLAAWAERSTGCLCKLSSGPGFRRFIKNRLLTDLPIHHVPAIVRSLLIYCCRPLGQLPPGIVLHKEIIAQSYDLSASIGEYTYAIQVSMLYLYRLLDNTIFWARMSGLKYFQRAGGYRSRQ